MSTPGLKVLQIELDKRWLVWNLSDSDDPARLSQKQQASLDEIWASLAKEEPRPEAGGIHCPGGLVPKTMGLPQVTVQPYRSRPEYANIKFSKEDDTLEKQRNRLTKYRHKRGEVFITKFYPQSEDIDGQPDIVDFVKDDHTKTQTPFYDTNKSSAKNRSVEITKHPPEEVPRTQRLNQIARRATHYYAQAAATVERAKKKSGKAWSENKRHTAAATIKALQKLVRLDVSDAYFTNNMRFKWYRDGDEGDKNPASEAAHMRDRLNDKLRCAPSIAHFGKEATKIIADMLDMMKEIKSGKGRGWSGTKEGGLYQWVKAGMKDPNSVMSSVQAKP